MLNLRVFLAALGGLRRRDGHLPDRQLVGDRRGARGARRHLGLRLPRRARRGGRRPQVRAAHVLSKITPPNWQCGRCPTLSVSCSHGLWQKEAWFVTEPDSMRTKCDTYSDALWSPDKLLLKSGSKIKDQPRGTLHQPLCSHYALFMLTAQGCLPARKLFQPSEPLVLQPCGVGTKACFIGLAQNKPLCHRGLENRVTVTCHWLGGQIE